MYLCTNSSGSMIARNIPFIALCRNGGKRLSPRSTPEDEWKGFWVSLGFTYKMPSIPHVIREQELRIIKRTFAFVCTVDLSTHPVFYPH
jgi:hypothetical protein